MEEAQELSDRIAIMDNGKIIALGSHQELIEIVGELDRICLTINEKPLNVIRAWESLEGVEKVTAEDGRINLFVKDSNRVLPDIFETAAKENVRITGVDIQEPNLEAVFLHLTGRALRD